MPLIIIFVGLLIALCLFVFGVITVPVWAIWLLVVILIALLGWKIMGPLIKG